MTTRTKAILYMGHQHKFIPTPEDYMIAVSVQSSAGQLISIAEFQDQELFGDKIQS